MPKALAQMGSKSGLGTRLKVWPGSLEVWPSSLKVWPAAAMAPAVAYGASSRYGVRAAEPRATYSSTAGVIAPAGAIAVAGPDFEAAGPDFKAAGPDFEAARPDFEAAQTLAPWAPLGPWGPKSIAMGR